MNQRMLAIIDLKKAGYVLERHGANHDIYRNYVTGYKIPLKRHDFNNNDRKYINKEIRKKHGKN